MPMLGIDRNELYWKFFFLNCYIGVEDYPHYDNHFFLLFKFKNIPAYETVRKKLKEHKLYKTTMKHSTKNEDYFIFVFNIPKEQKNNVQLFKEGKYSKFTREYKNSIFKVHRVKQDKPLYHILNKTKTRRLKLSKDLDWEIPEDVDLWDIPYMDEEILSLKNLE